MTNARSVAPWSPALFLALCVAAAVAGCADQRAPRRDDVHVAAAAAQLARGGEPGLAAADRAMRITIETSLEVRDIGEASAGVRAAVARAHGHVGEAKSSGSEASRFASFEVHVPVAALPAFREEIARLGDVASDAEKAEDVTEQRADIKARLANARSAEKRLLELLDKHTGNLADVVAVEKELTTVRETIERMEAQERVLEGQIASATVKIQLSTRHVAGSVGPLRRIARAAGEGIENAGSFLVGAVVLTASAGPTLLILAAIGYAIFRAARALSRRSQAQTKPPGGQHG